MPRSQYALSVALLSFALLLFATPSTAQTALTNADIVKLSEAGLSDELIIAKIKQAPEAGFDLEVQDLIELRQAGLSESVVTAMLERVAPSTEQASSPDGGTLAGSSMALSEDLGFDVIKVALSSNESSTPLRLLRGELSSSGFMSFRLTFMDYPGLRAQVRTSDSRPTLLIRSRTPLTGGRYFLAKLDVDEDDGIRSLKISSAKKRFRAMAGSSRSFMEPDQDWTIEYSVEEEGPELWRVIPKDELASGEYGWYVDLGASAQSSGIYDFGVD